MQPVSAETITKVWDEHADKGFFEIEKDIAALSKEQPALVNYLMTANSSTYNFEEQQMLLYFGVAIWKIMMEAGANPGTISMDDLENANDENIELIEKLEKRYPGDFAVVVAKIFNDYNQKELLDHIRKGIFNASDEKANIRTNSKGLMLFDLKAIVDCLDT